MEKLISDLSDDELKFLTIFKDYLLCFSYLNLPKNLLFDSFYLEVIKLSQQLIETISKYLNISYCSILKFIYEGEKNGKI